MYSPDGFASLLCLMKNQCQFLSYQEPFVNLMQLLSGNYIAFFTLQALTWFALIGTIYFLSKTLGAKHLFLTPFLLLFAGSLFIDNYVGNFENDYIAIILFITAIILYLQSNKLSNKICTLGLFGLGTTIWMWIAYFRLPIFWNEIAEQNWWAQILAWNLLTPIYLLAVTISIRAIWNKKDEQHLAKMCLIAFCFPKLWFFAIPMLIKTIDTGLIKLDFKQNYKFYMTIIVFALLLGQFMRVGIFTYQAWSYEQDSKCYTVNHEYLGRLKGISLNYNQASIVEYNECIKREATHNGT